jgi:hypothetical protein
MHAVVPASLPHQLVIGVSCTALRDFIRGSLVALLLRKGGVYVWVFCPISLCSAEVSESACSLTCSQCVQCWRLGGCVGEVVSLIATMTRVFDAPGCL